MTEPHPADTWQPPPQYELISAQESRALADLAGPGCPQHVLAHDPKGRPAIKLTGTGDAEWALTALRALRNPRPPEPPVEEEVRRLHPHLVEGRRYRIDFDDCGVQGHLHGVYLGPAEYDADEGGGLCGYRFDTGVLEPEWGSFSFTEAPEDR